MMEGALNVETWRPIPESDLYEVSDLGRVRSWQQWRGTATPRILHPTAGSDGYLQVQIHAPGGANLRRAVHALVATAFLGPRPNGAEVRHLDGNRKRNTLPNLAYGSRSENQQDAVRHGTHASIAKTACKHGHPFTPGNTYLYRGKRHCRECRRWTWRVQNTRRRDAHLAVKGHA